MTVLRNRGLEVTHGDGRIFLAGVDDTWTRRHHFEGALGGDRPGRRCCSRTILRCSPSGRAGGGFDVVGPHPRRPIRPPVLAAAGTWPA